MNDAAKLAGLTAAQLELLKYAVEGDQTILSVGGGDDEKWWRELSTDGWMESAALPDGFNGVGGLSWSAWNVTDKGRAAIAAATGGKR